MKAPSYSILRGTPENWLSTRALTDFHNYWSSAPSPATSFRALYDETYLHFRFDVEDSDVVIGKEGSAIQQVLDSDRVEIFFAANTEITPYYAFEIAPSGSYYSYRSTPYRQVDPEWACLDLKTDAVITPDGYQVTGSIPLATLRAWDCLHENQIIAGLHRAEFTTLSDGSIQRDWITWVNPGTPKADFHTPASFGTLVLE